MRVCNDILQAIDEGQEVVLVLLDLSFAFDTIDHKVLLDRLRIRYSFSGTVLDWFRSYLSNRTQSVKIGKDLSAETEVRYGVPQGSVLGPLLFSLFFAPVEDVIEAHGLDCMMYADDSQLYIVINPRSDRSAFLSKIELCVSDVFTCCTNNGLACNPGKSEVVHFRSCHARTCEPIKTITIGNAAISAMPVVRDLGALLDQHLLLKKQINNTCKGAWYVIQKIGRIRPYLSQEVCERLVHAFISSKLDSYNSILYGLPVTELNKLQRVQNAAARLISRTPKSHHTTPIYSNNFTGYPLKTESVSSSFSLLSRHFIDLLQSISANSLNHIIGHVPSVQVHLTISLFLSLTLQPMGTDVSLLSLQNCGTPYLAISVTLKTCALLKLVLRHGFLNPHLI